MKAKSRALAPSWQEKQVLRPLVISRFDCVGSSRHSVRGTLEAKPLRPNYLHPIKCDSLISGGQELGVRLEHAAIAG